MARTLGLRMAAGVLGVLGAAISLVLALLMVLFGGVLETVSSPSGNSVAGAGLFLLLFGAVAVAVSAGFFVLPRPKGAAMTLAVLTAGILWAFARVDAVALSMVVVVPMCFAVLCGLAAGLRSEDPANS